MNGLSSFNKVFESFIYLICLKILKKYPEIDAINTVKHR